MPSIYVGGPITVANNATTFVLDTGALLAEVKEGDTLEIDGVTGTVATVVDNENGTLYEPWAGLTATDEADYLFKKTSILWHRVATVSAQVAELLARVNSGGKLWHLDEQPPDLELGLVGDLAIHVDAAGATLFVKDEIGWDAGTLLVGINVLIGSGVPGAGLGNNDDIYIRTDTGGIYKKAAGSWSFISIITGAQGIPGPAGASPTPTFNLDTSSQAATDPGPGNFKTNHVTFASSTQFYIDTVDLENASVAGWLDTWDDYGSSLDRGLLVIVKVGVGGGDTMAVIRVTGSVAGVSTWRSITGSVLTSNGSFSNGTDFSFLFIPRGTDGPPGAAGTSGVSPGRSIQFKTDTTDSDPLAGFFKADNPNFEDITVLWINLVDTAWIESLDDSTNSGDKGRLHFQNPSVSTGVMSFKVTGDVVDKGSYYEIPVEPLAGDVFTNNLSVVVNFSPAGSLGGVGPAGASLAPTLAYDSTVAAAADPGNGEFRLDHAAWGSAIKIYIDDLAYGGGAISAWVDTWDDQGDTTERGILYLVDFNSPENFAILRVINTVTVGSGFRTVEFEVIQATAAMPTAGEQVGFLFIPSASVALPARLGAVGELLTNWDNAIDAGNYYGIGASNSPASGTFIGTVTRNDDSSFIVQRVRDTLGDETDTQAYERIRDTGVWSDWYRVRSSQEELDSLYGTPAAVPEVTLESLGIVGFALDGDPSTAPDETVALQAAVTDHPYLRGDPNRRYKISARVERATGDFRIEDVHFFGTAAGFTNTTEVGLTASTTGTMLSIHGAKLTPFAAIKNVTVRNCKFEMEVTDGKWVIALHVCNVDNAVVEGNEVYNFSSAFGIDVSSCLGARIAGNFIHDFLFNVDTLAAAQSTGISIDAYRVDISKNSTNVSIIDNRIRDLVFGSVALAEYNYQTDAITFGSVGAVGFVIANNIIENVHEGIDSSGWKGVIIGNTLRKCHADAIKIIHGARDVVISGNVVDQFGRNGIGIFPSYNGDADGILVIGNHVRDGNWNGAWDATAVACITMDDSTFETPTNFVVRNCVVAFNVLDPGAAGDYALIRAAAGGTNNTYVGNVAIRAGLQGTWFDAGTETNSYQVNARDIPGLSLANIWAAAQQLIMAGPNFISRDTTAQGSVDVIYNHIYNALNASSVVVQYAWDLVRVQTKTAGAHSAYRQWRLTRAGVDTTIFELYGGVVVGLATGGDPGVGKLNANQLQEAGVALSTKYANRPPTTIDNGLVRFDSTAGLIQAGGANASLSDADILKAAKFYTVSVTIADDAVYSQAMVGTLFAHLHVLTNGPQWSGIAWIRADGTVSEKQSAGGANFAIKAGGGALTGTTGTDGNVTVSTHSDGKWYVENRSSVSLTLTMTLIGTP